VLPPIASRRALRDPDGVLARGHVRGVERAQLGQDLARQVFK
jgi:hypothetical protein